MSKMTVVQFGVVVFALCLSTQVVSENTTDPTAGGNSTTPGSTFNITTLATDTFSANSTSPTGAGVPMHAGRLSFLLPVIMATSVLHRYC